MSKGAGQEKRTILSRKTTMQNAYMYILKCSDGTFYTGSTTHLEKRFAQHQNGEGPQYTQERRPVELVYFEEYQQIKEAFYREHQVKGWSRKKKLALIEERVGDLPGLAKGW